MPYDGQERRMNSPREMISLRDHVESLLHGIEERIDLRLDAMDKALILGREEVARRLGELNQLRREVETDRSRLLPRETFDTYHAEGTTWRERVEKRLTQIETRAITWGAALAVFVVILNFALRAIGK